MYCPAIVIVTMYFEEKRAFATGIAVCGAGIGTFIFSPLSAWLIDMYTWRGAFLIYAGLILTFLSFSFR
jgi:MFS family permease